MGNIYAGRLAALRDRMKKAQVDAYLVPTDDFHLSEYVGDFFKCRKYLTGFTGSAGTALVTEDFAGLWTDGRYFLQAERELTGSGFVLMKMQEEGVPTLEEYVKEHLTKEQVLGFDGRCVSAKMAKNLEEKVGCKMSPLLDLVGDIWEDRPALSHEPAWELGLEWAGESRKDKLSFLRKEMEKAGTSVHLLSSLDDIAWLLNIRGGDIHC
ncbi:MAG: aminopeptidase P family N-terminal domain-containing protein, partial [Blautia sp.]|nr:aminopeptidase P family N-terminal domain-containing protein [Blautia sp.]